MPGLSSLDPLTSSVMPFSSRQFKMLLEDKSTVSHFDFVAQVVT